MMNIAVLFAGGVGSRMRSKDVPKQFLEIHGKPIIVRTAELFQNHSSIDAIVVVCVQDWIDHCSSLLRDFGIAKLSAVVEGGETGQDSIYQGLLAAKRVAGDANAVVLIHDGVRPLIKAETITDNIESVERYGSAITVVRAKETILSVGDSGDIEEIPPRDSIQLARAPQSFWLDDVLDAQEWARAQGRHDFIDSASLMKAKGNVLHTVVGPDENMKITTPGDFFAMQAILNARENEQIYGLE